MAPKGWWWAPGYQAGFSGVSKGGEILQQKRYYRVPERDSTLWPTSPIRILCYPTLFLRPALCSSAEEGNE